MPVELGALIAPDHTALVTQEIQRGVVGDLAALPVLAEEFRTSGALGRCAQLVTAARLAGVAVVHCVAARRSDGRGSNTNARLFMAMRRDAPLELGSPAVDVLPELGVAGSDIVLTRLHGVGPMGGTELDAVLRNLGVRTIVGVGVSTNVGMLDFAFDAVNAGYQMVIPRDAVAGVPAEYSDAVLEHTIALVATVPSTDEVVAIWKS